MELLSSIHTWAIHPILLEADHVQPSESLVKASTACTSTFLINEILFIGVVVWKRSGEVLAVSYATADLKTSKTHIFVPVHRGCSFQLLLIGVTKEKHQEKGLALC